MDTDNQDDNVTKFDEDDDPESLAGDEVAETSELEADPDEKAAR